MIEVKLELSRAVFLDIKYEENAVPFPPTKCYTAHIFPRLDYLIHIHSLLS